VASYPADALRPCRSRPCSEVGLWRLIAASLLYVLENILPVENDIRYPKCIVGKMACPPEDVGGVTGYGHFLKIIKNPQDEEHEDTLIWAGGSFEPNYFSVDAANEKL